MPGRYYYCTLILAFINCAPFFHRRSEFEKGLEFYQQLNFREAAKHFDSHYVKHPSSDTTLYYLYDCFKRLNQPGQEIKVLERFAEIGSKDKTVYLNLFYYYRKMSRYNDLYKLLINLEPSIKDIFNERCVLTRRLYGEILSGATKKSVYSDPVIFAVSEGYIPVYPNGEFYADDTITNGNLIIILDRLVDPIYPHNFFKMKNISSSSFLYLPYMRLVQLGIIEYDPELNPDECASVIMAAKAVANLKNGGLID